MVLGRIRTRCSPSSVFQRGSERLRIFTAPARRCAHGQREVTRERIKGKTAASKRKGMWMGGNVPIGYDVNDRKLVVNTAEATTVRMNSDMVRYAIPGR